VVIFLNPELSQAEFALRVRTASALRLVHDGAPSGAEAFEEEGGEEALEVSGVVRTVVELEPGCVPKLEARLELVGAFVQTLGTALKAPTTNFVHGFLSDQDLLQKALQLLPVGFVGLIQSLRVCEHCSS